MEDEAVHIPGKEKADQKNEGILER